MIYKFMNEALSLAKEAALCGNVPIGAVIVKDKKIVASAFNGKYPCEHAELKAINEACKKLDYKNLDDCELYVTMEPCPMCAGAILLSGIKTVWFGAYDEKYGACISKDNSFLRYNNISKVMVNGGIMEEECSNLIKNFFKEKRGRDK